MASISPEKAARELLECCKGGIAWNPDRLDRLIEPDASQALFAGLVEPLADLFEPALCDAYAELFAQVIARLTPLHAGHLVERYRRVRRLKRFVRDPSSIETVFVLSRVTLGADVAVTSVLLDGAKHVFPHASIVFAGPSKSWELFAGDPRIAHAPLAYGRSASLESRLAVWPMLRDILAAPRSIVLDPDSRLTQLGLLPVCSEEDYFFFESRSYGGESDASLPELARAWVDQTFGYPGARPYLAPLAPPFDPSDITVSFGVGDNPAKRAGDRFEANLLRLLARTGNSILIDRGAGGEEAERVDRAVSLAGGDIRTWDGSFAAFAAQVGRSRLYLGYDSAGGHVAAASGVPGVVIFGGHASERMFSRWRPSGRGPIRVVRASTPEATLDDVVAALGDLGFS